MIGSIFVTRTELFTRLIFNFLITLNTKRMKLIKIYAIAACMAFSATTLMAAKGSETAAPRSEATAMSAPVTEGMIANDEMLASPSTAVAPEATTPKAVAAPATKTVRPAVTTTTVTHAPKMLMKRMEKAQRKAEIKETNGGKSQVVALLLCFFFGWIGVHRFYLGYTGVGILMFFTGGLFGILTLIDFIRIIVGDLKPKGGEYGSTF